MSKPSSSNPTRCSGHVRRSGCGHSASARCEVIIADPVMTDAYRVGVPGNGLPFPDGSKVAKIHWNAKKSLEFLHDLDFMVTDSKRFPDTGAGDG